ncbi:MAG TPA: hypothetical protein VLL76_07775, partial [Candidatus Omnitrophota bacterium]|nr:hypothetical protein [Candidatus Omnitrophota bacterium]
NEVLLRRDLSMAEMAAMLTEVRQGAGVPVTTAEIWSAWLRHPELANAVDVLTVHILPYWDVQADDMAEVLAFTENSVKSVAQAYAHKPIFIGEVGWPSFGRARGGVAPGLVEQAEFLRGLVAMAARNGWSYNAIEGFDQPWKRRWEGAAGGYWGVLDADGALKWPLAGPVSANPSWLLQAQAAIALGVGLLFASLASAGTGRRWWLAALLAAPAAAILVQQALFSAAIVARLYEPVLALGALTASGVFAVLGLAVAAGREKWDIPNLAEAMAGRGRRLGWLTLAVRVGIAALALALLFDPRHRDFHSVIVALPALVLAVAVRMRATPPERLLGVLVAACGVAVAVREMNADALGWAAICLLTAWPLVMQRQHQAQRGGGGVGEGVAEGKADDADRHGDQRAKAPAEAG